MIKLRNLLKVAWSALKSQSNQAFYDRISPIYDEVFVEHRIHAETMARLLCERYKSKKQQTLVLDLGCGTGMVSKLLTEKGFMTIGLDESFESLRLLVKKNTGCSVIQARAENLPLKDGRFQSVVCLGVWRHFPDPRMVLDEITRVLDKDGVLIVGYFPPSFAGLIHAGSGPFDKLLSWLYHMLTKKLGYHDRTDSKLEQDTLDEASKRFETVSEINSGKHWRLISAQYPQYSKNKPFHGRAYDLTTAHP